MKRLHQFIFLWVIFLFGVGVYAQSESELDSMFLDNDPTAEPMDTDVFVSEKKLEVYGFVENENYFGATGKQKNKDREIIKLETRARVNLKFGTPFYHFFSSIDAYFYPEIYPDAAIDTPARQMNPHLPSRQFALEAQEIYIKAGEKLQFKAGKQLFGWGKADAFKLTNYLDQADIRELFAKGQGDQNRGVLALSLKYLFGDFSVETALVPLHHAPLYPANGTFWAIAPETQMVKWPGATFIVTPTVDNGKGLSARFGNMSGAIRLGGSFGSVDTHISLHSGIDKSIFFIPKTTIPLLAGTAGSPDTSQEATIEIAPYYNRVNQAGFEAAWVIDRFSFRSEFVYSHDKVAIVKDVEKGQRTFSPAGPPAATSVTLYNKVEKEKYLGGAIGMDVQLWGNDSLFLVEYTKSDYLANSSRYSPEFFNNFLLVRLEDKFFNQKLETKIGIIIRPKNKDTGYAPNGEIGWNFQNGLTMILGGVFFFGDNDPLFKLYRDANMVFTRIRYNF